MYSNDTALASHASGIFLLQRHQSQILTHAMKIVTILWPLLGLDQLWYLVSSARASLICQTRLEVTFGLHQKPSPCCRMDETPCVGSPGHLYVVAPSVGPSNSGST